MSTEPDVVQYADFARLQLRVGTVLEAHDHPNADKLIVLKVDLGDQQRQIVAGLRGHYAAAELVGRQIIVVANLAPRVMRGMESQGMLLAACTPDQASVVVLAPERPVAAGTPVS